MIAKNKSQGKIKTTQSSNEFTNIFILHKKHVYSIKIKVYIKYKTFTKNVHFTSNNFFVLKLDFISSEGQRIIALNIN